MLQAALADGAAALTLSATVLLLLELGARLVGSPTASMSPPQP